MEEGQALSDFILVKVARETEYTKRWNLFGGVVYKLAASK